MHSSFLSARGPDGFSTTAFPMVYPHGHSHPHSHPHHHHHHCPPPPPPCPPPCPPTCPSYHGHGSLMHHHPPPPSMGSISGVPLHLQTVHVGFPFATAPITSPASTTTPIYPAHQKPMGMPPAPVPTMTPVVYYQSMPAKEPATISCSCPMCPSSSAAGYPTPLITPLVDHAEIPCKVSPLQPQEALKHDILMQQNRITDPTPEKKKPTTTTSTKKTYRCEYCGKELASVSSRRNHTYIHTDKWPHRCAYCGKGCPSKTHLRNHMRKHTDASKPYQCQHCGMRFAHEKSWQMHMHSHSNVANNR